jgi:hypothetical protein
MAVVKLAQPGYDVKTAGDENLIYSSLWPLLKIYKQDKFTVSDVTQITTIAEHDLNFPAMFWFFSNATIDKWLGTGTMANERRSEFFGPIGANASIKVNENKLVYEPGGFATGSLNLYYYIFGIDLTKQFTAPIIKVGAQSAGRATGRVFKLAKEGKSMDSNDLSDFVVHSKARSPLLHSVNPSPGVVKTFTVEHNLGYNPMFFGYVRTDGYYTLIATGTGGSSNFTATENTVTFNDTGGKEITIVILKDPFLIDYTVQVNV